MTKVLDSKPIDITYIHAKTDGMDVVDMFLMLTAQLAFDDRLAGVEPSVRYNNDRSEIIVQVNARKGGEIPLPPKFQRFLITVYSDEEMAAVHAILGSKNWNEEYPD